MGRKIRAITYLLPMILIYGLLIIGGMTFILIESLGYIPSLGLMDVNLRSYVVIFGTKGFVDSVLYSLYIAITSTIIATYLGVRLAYHMLQAKEGLMKRITRGVLQMGMILPYLYMVFLVMLSISKSGIVSRLFMNLNIINDIAQMPSLLYNQSGFGIIFVFVLKGLPFVTLFTLNYMSGISRDYENLGKTLGCHQKQIRKLVYIPMSKDVIIWVSCIILAYDLGSFEVPYILGALRSVTLSSKLYSMYLSPDILGIPLTMAMTLILFVVGVTSISLYATILNRILRGYNK